MSKKSGIPYNTLYTVSTGLINAPKQITFEKIAKFANKDAQQLKADWQAWRKESLEQD
jgi:hypothetical protein